jgi:outer membrane lipoprotein-sorting protein
MRVTMSRRARWAVPAAAVVATGAVIAGLQIPAAQASPNLPAKTPAQLLASLSSDAKVPPLTGTVVETASLGLPQLPQMSNATSTLSLLTGSHTVRVYYQDSSHFRLAVPQPGSETDVIADGTKLWLWESTTDSVTEFVPPAGPAKQAEQKVAAKAPVLTPQQAANQVLAQVGKTTLVSVQDNVMVAGDPAYQLVLAPRDHRSLIGAVKIAIDGKYGVPLRVQVYAKGAKSPAFQVGYTDLQFVAPSTANFAFTPPPRAKVDVVKLGSESGKKSTPAGETSMSGFGTYGKSWLTVASFPQADLMKELAPNAAGLGAQGTSSGKQPDIYSANGNGVGVSSQELLNALLGSAKPVSGSWGSGTLVSTSLVSMLMTGGEVYIGAVEPSVLYAAVGHTEPASSS